MDVSDYSTIPTTVVCAKTAPESSLARIRLLNDVKRSVWKHMSTFCFLHRTGKTERLSHNRLRHQLNQIELPIRSWSIPRIKTRPDVVIDRFRTGHTDGSRVKPDRRQTCVLGNSRAIKSKSAQILDRSIISQNTYTGL